MHKNKNEENIIPMEKYMLNKFKFLGIKSIERREISKECLKKLRKENFSWAVFNSLWIQEEREFQYIAIDYLKLKKKELNSSDLPTIKKYIVSKAWWDSVDNFYSVLSEIGLNYKINNEMISWSKDENLWIRRISIIHQLHRKEKTNTKLLEKILKNNFSSHEFFINKAIGWALRDYSKTDLEWVKNFIEDNKNFMDKLSIKEGSKYLK
ncbi:DNA alkylation repair protein [Miniphocaeibacter halophilus]|uniref:DNA alkylation repair protein n=2 Tax=Miniphocaeibacter halophilus TaxID=2931922 RepID=A0AC61MU08_9FIRM|nr:DNA alkylation repair protein [Miniphocaeibacter halophilus]